MLFSRAGLLLAITALVAAAPHNREERRSDASALMKVRTHKEVLRDVEAGICDTSRIKMPQAPKPLPPVSEGLSLYHIALGHGTQNYTCDIANSTSTPVAAGALATLYNVTCMTAEFQTFASNITKRMLGTPNPVLEQVKVPERTCYPISGHHYFTDLSTAFFNLDTDATSYGEGGFKKINSTASPVADITSAREVGLHDGTVPWLKLVSKEESTPFKEVYRIHTEGGQAPASCEGQEAEFQVQYAAEYWFYA